VEDPYTPNGIENPALPTEKDDIYNDHTFSYTWKTTYPEKMRRVDAKIGTTEKVHNV
jgi:transketolase